MRVPEFIEHVGIGRRDFRHDDVGRHNAPDDILKNNSRLEDIVCAKRVEPNTLRDRLDNLCVETIKRLRELHNDKGSWRSCCHTGRLECDCCALPCEQSELVAEQWMREVTFCNRNSVDH